MKPSGERERPGLHESDPPAVDIMALAPVCIGDVVAGKYEVEHALGAGGMGVVVAARHVQLQRRVALKFLLPHLTADAGFASRFVREGQAAARIASEHVARVLDVDTLEGGAPYMVIEYLEGRTLDDVLAARRALPVAEAVGYVLQAMEGVAEAHSLGIVHRDLKPSNLFVADQTNGTSVIKVFDFGISKSDATGAGVNGALTRSNNVLGSPVYMSPEQVRSARDVDARTDVWSFGIILYELLAGAPPFCGESVSATLAAVVADEPPSLLAVRPDVAPQLERIILRCLAKARQDRFPDVAALANALVPWGGPEAATSAARVARQLRAGSSGVSSLAPSSASVPGSRRVPTGTTTQWGPRAEHGRTRGRRAMIAGVLGGVAVLTTLAALVRTGRIHVGGPKTMTGQDTPAAPALRPPAADSPVVATASVASAMPVALTTSSAVATATPVVVTRAARAPAMKSHSAHAAGSSEATGAPAALSSPPPSRDIRSYFEDRR